VQDLHAVVSADGLAPHGSRSIKFLIASGWEEAMKWDIRYASSQVADEEPTFAQSVVAGNVVFVSGCTCGKRGKPAPRRVEDQVDLALENTRRALEAAGSRMENVVKTFFLLTSLDHYGRVRKTETEFYERYAPQLVTTPPAATLMVVPSLACPEFLVQYEVIAALNRGMPDWPVMYYPEFWAGKELAYPHVPKEHAKFARSQSIGNLLIISGCQGLDHETVRVETSDFAEQSRIVLDKIRVAVKETGGSLANLVKTNVFIKDANGLTTYREIEQAFFREHAPEIAAAPPAGTVFVMTELPRPEFLIEVEAFAVANAATPGWPMHRQAGTAEAAESATAGNLVFLSACNGSADEGSAPKSIEREVSIALDNLGDALARAGSAISEILKITLMLSNVDDYPKMESALFAFYREHAPQLVETPPATTFMEVAAIVPSGARFQIDAVAVTSPRRRGSREPSSADE
jgi:2-iminobutanoate/2-iminopropanoate deaminase